MYNLQQQWKKKKIKNKKKGGVEIVDTTITLKLLVDSSHGRGTVISVLCVYVCMRLSCIVCMLDLES